jgi:hypothetical protein
MRAGRGLKSHVKLIMRAGNGLKNHVKLIMRAGGGLKSHVNLIMRASYPHKIPIKLVLPGAPTRQTNQKTSPEISSDERTQQYIGVCTAHRLGGRTHECRPKSSRTNAHSNIFVRVSQKKFIRVQNTSYRTGVYAYRIHLTYKVHTNAYKCIQI